MKKLLLMLAPLLLLTTSFAQAATHSVTLSWTPSTSACVTTVNVHRVTVAGTEAIGTNFAVVAVPVATFTDTTVVAGTTYFYKVSAFCSSTGLESVLGNEFTATIPNDPPVAPSGLTGVVK